MRLRWDKWLYGVGSAFVGGGSSAVAAGFTNLVIAPGTFNLSTLEGAHKLLLSMAVTFGVAGALSMFFYLKQSPLPAPEDSDPAAFRKKVEAAVEVEKAQEVVRDKDKE